MNWDQIRELNNSDNVEIGNHSHSHEYLVDETAEVIKKDISKSIQIFKDKLGKNSEFFLILLENTVLNLKILSKHLVSNLLSVSIQELLMKQKISGELPRFPINEKYGEIKRFKTLMRTLPLKYRSIEPEDKYLVQSKNPPKVKIRFYDNINNLKNINCFSNEGNKWRNSKIFFINDDELKIEIVEKFIGERGRINCSLKETDGFWRWLGIQYVVSEK